MTTTPCFPGANREPNGLHGKPPPVMYPLPSPFPLVYILLKHYPITPVLTVYFGFDFYDGPQPRTRFTTVTHPPPGLVRQYHPTPSHSDWVQT
eukprot:707208-Hanusia_phi.AAC.1